MARAQRTLRRQLLSWLFWPLLALWSVSSVIDYDIANRFVNLAYDRVLLESALDIGRQVKVLQERIYVDLPEIAVQMLQSRQSGRLYYLVTDPRNEYITGEPDRPPARVGLSLGDDGTLKLDEGKLKFRIDGARRSDRAPTAACPIGRIGRLRRCR